MLYSDAATNDKNHVNGNGPNRQKGYVRTIMDVVDDYWRSIDSNKAIDRRTTVGLWID